MRRRAIFRVKWGSSHYNWTLKPRYGRCKCRRTCSWGEGMAEERGRRGDMMELGHPVRDLKSPSGELHRGLLSWAAICLWPGRSLTPSALCVLAFVIACKTVEVCARAIVMCVCVCESVGVDRALLLPSPGWQPSVWWSVAVITTGSESRGTITWVGQGKTGTVNIQPEINGCAQTYGYSDVGDVFGIPSSIN